MATYTLSIPAMKCGGCVSTVETSLKAVTKVDTVSVDLENKQATIEGDVELATLIAAVTDSGFPAEQV